MDRIIHKLEVWGELACFSRPELKVERFSYPVITPSAARGIFDAIYCKPNQDPQQAQFRWQIKKIEILNFPSFIPLRRNEVQEVVSEKNVKQWMEGKKEISPLITDEQRTQRQTIALKNVHYRIHGEIVPWERHKKNQKAFDNQFARRASRGQCVFHPYFGCREFPAFFIYCEDNQNFKPPIKWSRDLGYMLYDVFDLSKPGKNNSSPNISLFHAIVKDGVMEIPEYSSSEVLKGKEVEINA